VGVTHPTSNATEAAASIRIVCMSFSVVVSCPCAGRILASPERMRRFRERDTMVESVATILPEDDAREMAN
jgi:hypothetical protein